MDCLLGSGSWARTSDLIVTINLMLSHSMDYLIILLEKDAGR